jgi:cardiolipin synthase A/B
MVLQTHHLVTGFLVFSYVLGVLSSALAILRSRTPQGATAWIMALLSIPFISVPFFLFFGRSRFYGYNRRMKLSNKKFFSQFGSLKSFDVSLSQGFAEMKLLQASIDKANQPGFTRHNHLELLLNGQETFDSMIEEIKGAREYILFQVYIFRSDSVGEKFAELLSQKSREGIKVSLIYDEIGAKISKKLLKLLKDAGVKVARFNRFNGRGRLQVNFRNHRKIIVVDGRVAFVGGHNIGEEYLGLDPLIGEWRDTHVKLWGPSVLAAQLATAKDWYCCKGEMIDAKWEINLAPQDSHAMVLHTGPADERHTCLLAHLSLIHAAQNRLWIASPYWVVPESLQDALILAALRGVDVKLIMPFKNDSRTVSLASKVYQERFLEHGIEVYEFQKGFLHEKTMLVDECFGVVGSANFDCRSMFINFEVSVLTTQKSFITDLDQMFQEDLKNSRKVLLSDLKNMSLYQQILTRGANLFSPVL